MKQSFWTAYGQYMNGVPVFTEEGKKKNWLNYKTGAKNIRFKTDATTEQAYIAIELTHRDKEQQSDAFAQMRSLKNILAQYLQEDWEWEENHIDAHEKSFARIYTTLPNVNILRQEDWPTLIAFFKPRMLALDSFWEEVKDSFEESV